MERNHNEVGYRIVDEPSREVDDGIEIVTDWVSTRRQGLLSVQAWASNWNGGTVQLQLSHDKEHAVDVAGALFDENNRGLLGLPSGVYFRGVVSGAPVGLVVSAVPYSQ